MKEIDLIAGIDSRAAIKMTVGKKIIDCHIIMKGTHPIAEINCTIETGTTPKNTKETIHTVETDDRISMIVIDPMILMIHLAEIDCKIMTIKTTMKMIRGMTAEMTIRRPIKLTIERKIVGISETRGIKESTETIMKTIVKMGI